MSMITTTTNGIEANRELIRSMFCKGITQEEFELFLMVCKRTGLDPLMKQIYAIPRGNKVTHQTSIDGFRLIAERTGKYSPGREATYSYDEKNRVKSATSYVKKQTDDGTWHEVSSTAYMDEFAPDNSTFWKKMPHVMLAKVAEAHALRRAFPAQMSGIYSDDEMAQAPLIDVENEKNQPKPGPMLVPAHVIEEKKEKPKATKEQVERFFEMRNKVRSESFQDRLDTYLTKTLGLENAEDMHQGQWAIVMKTIDKELKKQEACEQERMA